MAIFKQSWTFNARSVFYIKINFLTKVLERNLTRMVQTPTSNQILNSLNNSKLSFLQREIKNDLLGDSLVYLSIVYFYLFKDHPTGHKTIILGKKKLDFEL